MDTYWEFFTIHNGHIEEAELIYYTDREGNPVSISNSNIYDTFKRYLSDRDFTSRQEALDAYKKVKDFIYPDGRIILMEVVR